MIYSPFSTGNTSINNTALLVPEVADILHAAGGLVIAGGDVLTTVVTMVFILEGCVILIVDRP